MERAEQSRLRNMMWTATLLTIACLVWIFYQLLTPPNYHSSATSMDLARSHSAPSQRGALPRKIDEAIRSGSPRKIFIKADARARYGDVEHVIDEIQSTGIQNIVFITFNRP